MPDRTCAAREPIRLRGAGLTRPMWWLRLHRDISASEQFRNEYVTATPLLVLSAQRLNVLDAILAEKIVFAP